MGIRLASGLCLLMFAGCAEQLPPEQTQTTYARTARPILLTKCTTSSGCHSTESMDGALDVTTYASLMRRRDLLIPSPSTGEPMLLAKASHVAHAGGHLFEVDSDAYEALAEWIDDGAPEN